MDWVKLHSDDPPTHCYQCGDTAVVVLKLDPKEHAGISNFHLCAEHARQQGWEG